VDAAQSGAVPDHRLASNWSAAPPGLRDLAIEKVRRPHVGERGSHHGTHVGDLPLQIGEETLDAGPLESGCEPHRRHGRMG